MQHNAPNFGGNIFYNSTFNGETNFSAQPDRQFGLLCLQSLRARVLQSQEAVHKRLKKNRISGTSRWLLETDEMKNWLQEPTQACWFTAGPGRGKTMLAMYLVDQLKKRDSNTKVLYFFNGYISSCEPTHAMDILLVLLLQLIEGNSPAVSEIEVPSALLSAFKFQGNKLFAHAALPTLLSIFKQLVAEEPLANVRCVLDGVDECETDSMQDLFQVFFEMLPSADCDSNASSSTTSSPSTRSSSSATSSQNSSAPNARGKFNLAVFCRTEEAERFEYVMSNARRISLERRYRSELYADVQRYLRKTVDDISDARQWPASLTKEVESTLIKCCGNSFLWISFVVRELKLTKNAEVLATIKRVPQGLKKLYEQILSKVQQASSPFGRLALQWVLCARRKLRVGELNEALISTEPDLQHQPDLVTDAVKLTYGFLQIQHEGGDVQEVDFCHTSISDFLSSLSEPPGFLRSESMHLNIAKYCLDYVERKLCCHETRKIIANTWRDMHRAMMRRYLDQFGEDARTNPLKALMNFFQFEWLNRSSSEYDPGLLLLQEVDLRTHPVPGHAMFWYAVRWWPAHIQQCKQQSASFLLLERPLLDWFRENSVNEKWDDRQAGKDDDSSSSNATENSLGQTSSPTLQSHEHGAETDFTGGHDTLFDGHLNEYGSGKHWWRMFRSMVLDSDVIGSPFTILHLSAYLHLLPLTELVFGKHLTVDLPLVDMINAQDRDGRTPLMSAAATGDIRTLEYLLLHGADVDLIDEDSDTALHLAARANNAGCVAALRKANADVQLLNSSYHAAMEDAVMARARAAIETLARNKMALNPPATDEKNRLIPLNLAARNGDYELAQMLLSKGADPAATDAYGNTALHALARSSFDTTDKEILPANVAQRYPLHRLVSLLVDHGIPKDCRNKQGQTPLMLAAAWLNTTVMDALLEGMSSDYVNLRDKGGLTAFLCGCYQVYFMQIYDIEMLITTHFEEQKRYGRAIERGGTADERRWEGAFLISRVLWRRRYLEGQVEPFPKLSSIVLSPLYDSVIKKLLGAGADPHVSIFGLSGLHLALLQPYDARGGLVQILLEHAPTLANSDGPLGRPVHLAASRGNLQALWTLIQHDVSFDVNDSNGKSALYHAITGVCMRPRNTPYWRNATLDLVIRPMSAVASTINDEKLLHLSLVCFHRWGFLKKLIDLGADRMLEDECGNIPIHYASALADGSTIDILLSGLNKTETAIAVDTDNSEGYNSILVAVLNGNVDTTTILCERTPRYILAESLRRARMNETFHNTFSAVVTDLNTTRTPEPTPAVLLKMLAKTRETECRWSQAVVSRFWKFPVFNCETLFHTRDFFHHAHYKAAMKSLIHSAFHSYERMQDSNEPGARSIDAYGLFLEPATRSGRTFPCTFRKYCCEYHRDGGHPQLWGMNLPHQEMDVEDEIEPYFGAVHSTLTEFFAKYPDLGKSSSYR